MVEKATAPVGVAVGSLINVVPGWLQVRWQEDNRGARDEAIEAQLLYHH